MEQRNHVNKIAGVNYLTQIQSMNYNADNQSSAVEQKGRSRQGSKLTAKRLPKNSSHPKKESTHSLQPKQSSVRNGFVRSACKTISDLMIKREYKDPTSPKYRGSEVSLLSDPPLGYVLVDTKESSLLRSTMSQLFGDKHYEFRCSTALNMSSSASGTVNSQILMNSLSFVTDFISLTSVFNEFFIRRCHVIWQPVSRYNYPLTGSSASNVSSLPIGVADLQHAQASYTSLSVMADNYRIAYHSSGDPFTFTWVNSESSSSTVVATASGATQSWCDTTNASNYQGNIQLLSQSAPPGIVASQVLGTFLVFWDVLFRVRS